VNHYAETACIHLFLCFDWTMDRGRHKALTTGCPDSASHILVQPFVAQYSVGPGHSCMIGRHTCLPGRSATPWYADRTLPTRETIDTCHGAQAASIPSCHSQDFIDTSTAPSGFARTLSAMEQQGILLARATVRALWPTLRPASIAGHRPPRWSQNTVAVTSYGLIA
jgi:hypothetical protein